MRVCRLVDPFFRCYKSVKNRAPHRVRFFLFPYYKNIIKIPYKRLTSSSILNIIHYVRKFIFTKLFVYFKQTKRRIGKTKQKVYFY